MLRCLGREEEQWIDERLESWVTSVEPEARRQYSSIKALVVGIVGKGWFWDVLSGK